MVTHDIPCFRNCLPAQLLAQKYCGSCVAIEVPGTIPHSTVVAVVNAPNTGGMLQLVLFVSRAMTSDVEGKHPLVPAG